MSRPAGKGENGRGELALGASTTERPSLRRGFLGYRREDVHLAFDARDAELAELRQDVAALWLAFGQHDRMIRRALEQLAASQARKVPQPPEPPPPSAVSRQLLELDDVLTAIETATNSLERSYAEQIAPPAATPAEPEAKGD